MSAPMLGPDDLLPLAGPVPQPGLDAFDADAAAQNLAGVYSNAQQLANQAPPSAPPVAAGPDALAPPSAPMAPQAAQPGQPEPPKPPEAPQLPGGSQAAQGGQPAPAVGPPPAPKFEALPPVPPPPKLTGNPEKDVQLNVEWHRQIADHQAKVEARKTEIAQHEANVQQYQAQRELAEAQRVDQARQTEIKQGQARMQERQHAIDQAVGERAAAYKDLEAPTWQDKHSGAALVAAIAGGIAAAFSNAAAAQLGQVGNAENQGVKTINAIMDRERKGREARLKAAGESVLEARYGFKDAADNHRAALNDLDADLASRYKLIAAEAATEIKRMGGDKAAVDGNAVVADAMAKQAEAEGRIHQREEEMGIKREDLRQREQDRRLDFALKREQIEATREARADARQGKKDAAELKLTEAHDARTLHDPDTGEPIVMLSNARAVPDAAKKLSEARAYSRGLRELADDIEQNGRVGSDKAIVGTDAGRRRTDLYNNVIGRGRKALDLGVSNANIQIEHGAVGGPGTGLDLHQMADPKRLRAIADEQDRIANERLRAMGTPIAGHSIPGTEPTGGAPARAQAAQGGQPGGGGDAAKDARAWQVISDPKAPRAEKEGAMRYLTDRGLL